MLYVISSLSYDTSLLSHFLKYYKSLGVTSFIISIHELVPGLLNEAQVIANQFDCEVKFVPVSKRQTLTGIEANNKEEIRVKYLSAKDWLIPADLDEFIQYPAPVEQILEEMKSYDATFIKGDFRDRITENGCLARTLRKPAIWEQFPLVCNISKTLVNCWCHKVTLCRGDCMLSSGHHNVITPARPLISRRCVVHHFKWRDGLLKALRRRVVIYKKAGRGGYHESERALTYLNRHKKINPDDFEARSGWNPDIHGLPQFQAIDIPTAKAVTNKPKATAGRNTRIRGLSKPIVIYTSITNSYDGLKELPEKFKEGAESIAFLDRYQKFTSWRVAPACSEFSDPCRNAKKPKILPHLYFIDTQYSLWLDGSIRVISRIDIAEMIDKYLSDCDIALFRHRSRKCIYREAKLCIRIRKDNANVIRRQIIEYKYENFPRNRGLAECCVILRRHTHKMQLLNEVWWDEICAHSRRDQLSFDFVCWKLGIRYNCFDGKITNNGHFLIGEHTPLVSR